MIIDSVLRQEAKRNNQMIEEYEELMKGLPKGTLIVRRNYYYLKYRENGKIQDVYIGKDSEKVADIKDKLERRKHYEKMLTSLRQEQKIIHKMMEGLK